MPTATTAPTATVEDSTSGSSTTSTTSSTTTTVKLTPLWANTALPRMPRSVNRAPTAPTPPAAPTGTTTSAATTTTYTTGTGRKPTPLWANTGLPRIKLQPRPEVERTPLPFEATGGEPTPSPPARRPSYRVTSWGLEGVTDAILSPPPSTDAPDASSAPSSGGGRTASYHVTSWGLEGLPGISFSSGARPTKGPMAQRPLAAKFAKPPKANSAAGGHGAKPSRSTAGKSLRQPPGLTMLVHGLPQHIAPSRLLSEFPTALTAEATYDATSGVRTSIVLTFESRQPPANRKSAALGARCSLWSATPASSIASSHGTARTVPCASAASNPTAKSFSPIACCPEQRASGTLRRGAVHGHEIVRPDACACLSIPHAGPLVTRRRAELLPHRLRGHVHLAARLSRLACANTVTCARPQPRRKEVAGPHHVRTRHSIRSRRRRRAEQQEERQVSARVGHVDVVEVWEAAAAREL